MRASCERVALRLGQQMLVEGAAGFASVDTIVAVAKAAAEAAKLPALGV